MTVEDAWKINKYVSSLEFPLLTETALQFALFRTYGIPTIAELLCQTQQLGKAQYAGRRYEDTVVLVSEFLVHAPKSERANSAIARMNYLHGLYQNAGKISNDDMLYTMALFVLEPIRWVNSYEWRQMTDMEICALATLWRDIGTAQNIDFSPLRHGPSSFRDGLEFYHDLVAWADAYEQRAMVPDAHNHQLAEETTAILLTNVPSFLKPIGRQAVVSLMDIRLRKAMIYDCAPSAYYKLVPAVFKLRAWFLTWLMPPRPYALRLRKISDEGDAKTGRFYKTGYESEPWYIKPTFWARNAPSSWLRWIQGRPYPDGKNWKPEGYDILEVGPVKLEGKGRVDCERVKGELMGRRGGCPFTVR